MFVQDFALAAGLSATAYGTLAAVGVGVGTAVAGPVAGAILGTVVVGVCAEPAYVWMRDEAVAYLERPLDETAEWTGHLAGAVAGSIAGANLGEAITFAWRYPTYAAYEAEARALTERSWAAAKRLAGERSLTTHLDHITSVAKGYHLGLPTAWIADVTNLRLIPAARNLALGSGL